MDYQILTAIAIRDLRRLVKELMEAGWEPQGGVCVTADKDGFNNFYQAMIWKPDRTD